MFLRDWSKKTDYWQELTAPEVLESNSCSLVLALELGCSECSPPPTNWCRTPHFLTIDYSEASYPPPHKERDTWPLSGCFRQQGQKTPALSVYAEEQFLILVISHHLRFRCCASGIRKFQHLIFLQSFVIPWFSKLYSLSCLSRWITH